MPNDKSGVLALVRNTLSEAELAEAIISWYDKPLPAGTVVQAGPQQLRAPFDATLLFADLKPKANWGHPCKYIFVSAADERTKVHDGQYPMFMDKPPPEYRVLLRYGEVPQDEHHFDPY